ncbi:T9SS type A sorting domain-containing protein [Mucilaginibacter sp.]|uniref:T9SS type A sorting domain-containing protein n=1 Tax=Mucilaginibacter sp. TaxID=1882438 RepID=UPI002B95CB38|nr:T9SS type A sorting domain-containing protein [Mucilaginibacter sp.]HTI60603.1 T9SS type A sorting domain-containing protein [Mucilaginibacter sp.]
MRQKYTYKISWIIMVACAVSINFAYAFQKSDTTIHFFRGKIGSSKSAPSYFKSGLHLTLPPIKPAAVSVQKVNVARPDDKLLTDVQVYPNPITDQINVKCNVSRTSLVTVKVMDVLGNDLITIASQRISSGEQNFSYPLNNKLQRGFYFIRVVAGTESVIKRISVL